MEFVTTVVLLTLAILMLIGYAVYVIIGIVKTKRNKKREMEEKENELKENELKAKKEFEKHKIAEGTIRRFKKNYDKLNPIILLDDTKVEFYEEAKDTKLNSNVALNKIPYTYGYEKFGFTYKIEDKVYNYDIYYGVSIMSRNTICLDYLAFEDDYLEGNQWIMDEVTRIVREKRLELDKEKEDRLNLKVDVLEHWLVKKVGK